MSIPPNDTLLNPGDSGLDDEPSDSSIEGIVPSVGAVLDREEFEMRVKMMRLALMAVSGEKLREHLENVHAAQNPQEDA